MSGEGILFGPRWPAERREMTPEKEAAAECVRALVDGAVGEETIAAAMDKLVRAGLAEWIAVDRELGIQLTEKGLDAARQVGFLERGAGS